MTKLEEDSVLAAGRMTIGAFSRFKWAKSDDFSYKPYESSLDWRYARAVSFTNIQLYVD